MHYVEYITCKDKEDTNMTTTIQDLSIQEYEAIINEVLQNVTKSNKEV